MELDKQKLTDRDWKAIIVAYYFLRGNIQNAFNGEKELRFMIEKNASFQILKTNKDELIEVIESQSHSIREIVSHTEGIEGELSDFNFTIMRDIFYYEGENEVRLDGMLVQLTSDSNYYACLYRDSEKSLQKKMQDKIKMTRKELDDYESIYDVGILWQSRALNSGFIPIETDLVLCNAFILKDDFGDEEVKKIITRFLSVEEQKNELS